MRTALDTCLRMVSASALAVALLTAAPAFAAAPDPAGDDAAALPPPPAEPGGRQVYEPAFFARFAPRSAWDMVQQIPGFSVRDNEEARGFGNATGNILINGVRPTNKTDDFGTQLSRIPASSVTRIEIVDGASLDMPGLSGQVANIVAAAGGLKGQFSWSPEFRAHYSDPMLLRSEVSISGKSGKVDYSLSLANQGGRSGAGGPTVLTRADGSVLELRDDRMRGTENEQKATGRVGIDLGTTKANLNFSVNMVDFKYRETSDRTRPGGIDRQRLIGEDQDSWGYEAGGDIAFPLAGGQMKLIGLRRLRDEDYVQNAVTQLADGSAPFGDIYRQDTVLGETIARAEYNWKMLGGDWQLSGEGAFNRLSSVASTGSLLAGGDFSDEPFAPGTGAVAEDRYDGSLSYGRALSPKVNLQIVAAAEYSQIGQGGPGGDTRNFFRPKGSVSLAWKASPRLDVSVKAMRRVLQLSLYDFLGRRFLGEENENAGNAELVPQQDWSLEIEANRSLGKWGSTKLRVIARDVQDYVTVVPLPGGGESTGNIAKARATAVDWTATVQLDPLGWKGAKLDLRALYQHSRITDPLTGRQRQYNDFTDRLLNITLRHDIPRSNWAWGAEAEYYHNQPAYRLNEYGRFYEGPVFVSAFIENKDVLGLTITARVVNLFDARSRWDRYVFSGPRDSAPLAFREYRDRLIGPIFRFTVKGNF